MKDGRKGGWVAGLVFALTIVACWDSATLNVTATELESGDASSDALADALPGVIPDTSQPDTSFGCPSPLVACGALCTDTRVDPLNCGGCGAPCGPPPVPTCNGQVATIPGPGICNASRCEFPVQTVDCADQGRECASGICGPCVAGLQDNDLNGSCTPACAPQSCSGNGLCSDATGTVACTCNPGFSGPTCATNIDDCAPNPCQNGGICTDGVAGHTCACPPDFTGNDCAILRPTFLWVDATDPATLTTDPTDHVVEWRDKSGLGRNAIVPAGSDPPLFVANLAPGGLPAIVFDGDLVRLQTAPVATSAEMTIFVVFNMVNPQMWGSLINQSHDAFFSIRKSDNGELNFHIENNNAAPLQPITTNTWKVVTALREGNVSTLYYEPTTLTSFTGDTLTGGQLAEITLGNAMNRIESMGGFIAEVRAFSSALPVATRATIEAQLKTKYGVP